MLNLKTFTFLQQVEHYDTDDIKVVEERIKSLTQLKTYAIIKHDKDKHDDGSDKAPHFHAVVTLKNMMTSSSIANSLHCEEQYISKIATSTAAAERYLVHANNPEKYQYSPDEVVASFDYKSKLEDVLLPRKTRLDEVFERIQSGEIREYNITDFVGISEYVRNYPAFDRAFRYSYEKMNRSDRNMICLFITGAAGSGKTTFAKQYCANNRLSFYVTDGGSNPLDSYKGQDCIIMDDLRPSDYKFNEFLKLTDNHTNSMARGRFYNKNLCWCKCIIVTSTLPFESWYKSLQESDGEASLQMSRRFTQRFVVEGDVIRCSQINSDTGGLEVVGCIKNPVVELRLRQKKERQKMLDSLQGFEFTPDSYVQSSLSDVDIDDLPF